MVNLLDFDNVIYYKILSYPKTNVFIYRNDLCLCRCRCDNMFKYLRWMTDLKYLAKITLGYECDFGQILLDALEFV